ncbi:DNA-binding protein HU-beta [Kribbella voronezhensis]|uniref:DNA-binding protein HU-beta n=1 Tax=Kribbella voronezhensis TaxID=2512212 RepID=A0A4R7TAS9_9ACTN|nr:DNA-binding protein HU-beta [Kribbella voronezhensis]
MGSRTGDPSLRRTVNRNELVAGVASKAGIPRNQAEKVLDALGDVVTEAVQKGDKVSLTGLLSIERVLRAPRTGRNPQTGEPLSIPAAYSVRLSCGSRLKAAARGNLRTVN